MVDVPRQLLWDYREAPADPAWRLQRIAEFFPHFGRDRETVMALYQHRDALRIPPELKDLITIYAQIWQAKCESEGA